MKRGTIEITPKLDELRDLRNDLDVIIGSGEARNDTEAILSAVHRAAADPVEQVDLEAAAA